ncbi:chemotaxis protein [Microvirga lenta]|uniref:chemotaxis protein n=1 Tax=Microvirga lenta TaxID=2881337 RepID=UPI001CFFECAF|nr:chemotaxis protein [Microvirga lenta]MCB5177752.1 chemotaxis protein [Microvirga lenta]
MRITFIAPILAGILTAVPAVAEEVQTSEPEKVTAIPVDLVRTLQIMQDQIATGSTNAHAAQRALLAHIDDRLMSIDPGTWGDSKNVRAAVIFVLSGGRPEILKRIIALGGLSEVDTTIVQGALAYVEGREADAKRFLSEVQIDTLPPMLAGQIALVQSALIVREDPAKSVQLLDRVRLLLPGTLVEEAALRREIFVVSQVGDAKKFDALSRQYLRRFRYSIYAGNFRQRFASALTRLDFAKDEQRFSRLVAILNELEAEGQRELYLMIARNAIEQGQTKAAILAADKAFELSSSDASSATRAKLYRAAAIIVTPEGFESGIEVLKQINRAELQPHDSALLDEALSLARHIRQAPQAIPVAEAAGPAEAPPAEAIQAQEPVPAISRAQEALEKIDRLFRSETR